MTANDFDRAMRDWLDSRTDRSDCRPPSMRSRPPGEIQDDPTGAAICRIRRGGLTKGMPFSPPARRRDRDRRDRSASGP